MDFFTQFIRPDKNPEIHPDKGMVEKTGYMRIEKLVSMFTSAGERNAAYREGMYGVDENGEECAPVYASAMDVMLMTRNHRKRIVEAKEAEEKEKVQMKVDEAVKDEEK